MAKDLFHYVGVFQLTSLGQIVMTLQSVLFINSLKNDWKLRNIPEIYTNPIAVYQSAYKNLNPMGVIKNTESF